MLSFALSTFGKILSRKLRLPRKRISLPVFGDPLLLPGGDYHGYRGFVSSSKNERGMQAQFFVDQLTGGACCHWRPSPCFESYPSLIHGGIGFALVDEVMGHAVWAQCGFLGMTAKASTKWAGVVRTDSYVIGKAQVKRRIWRFVAVKGWALDESGKILVASSSIFYLPSQTQLRRILGDPNIPEKTLNSCY